MKSKRYGFELENPELLLANKVLQSCARNLRATSRSIVLRMTECVKRYYFNPQKSPTHLTYKQEHILTKQKRPLEQHKKRESPKSGVTYYLCSLLNKKGA